MNTPKSTELLNQRLADSGLNLCAVFSLKSLPNKLTQSLASATHDWQQYNQLILIGNVGPNLWPKVEQWKKTSCTQEVSNHPLDDYSSIHSLQALTLELAADDLCQLYPGKAFLDLQSLGHLAGWHNDSPFKVGVNAQWGSWFAYRALFLTRSNFALTESVNLSSPCRKCATTPCISACPANAIYSNNYDLKACLDYRQSSNSLCADRCLAREACPAGEIQKYSRRQISYHYRLSLDTVIKLKDA